VGLANRAAPPGPISAAGFCLGALGAGERDQFKALNIADLSHAEALAAKRLAEAVQYRSLDRSYWS
jgi:hypothetical protein